MKIEVGKYYETSDGDIVGPMEKSVHSATGPFWYAFNNRRPEFVVETYNEDGSVILAAGETPKLNENLLREWRAQV